MIKHQRILIAILLIFLASNLSATDIWRNPAIGFEERTDDLISKLTLKEKTELMRFDSPGIDRLGIKAYNWWNESLHGVARSGVATVFPQAIGMAAMWDTAQMFSIASVIADEARAKYNAYQLQKKYGIYKGLTIWTPNINIFRDPRWGRGMETYGEDPYLSAELAIPFIKAMQGNDPRYFKLIATVKHFAVHSGPEALRHSFDVWPDDYDMEETYIPHFKRAVVEGGAYSVMCAYQRLKGVPCCGSQFLENLLRNQWDFQGYIVSDCGAIQDFYDENAHHVVTTPEEASAMAIKAGTDLNCGSVYARSLLKAVNQGLVSEEEINRSVKRLLLARMRLGEFDPIEEVPFSQIPLSVVESDAHQLVALEAARKSMVLLKNVHQTLPLQKSNQKIAVIGPNAHHPEILLGNYHGYAKNMVTPFEGIRQQLPQAEVRYALGCRLADELPFLQAIPAAFFYTEQNLKTKGLTGKYFQDKNMRGIPKHKRIDANIDFTWWSDTPFTDMKTDSFSVSWQGVLVPPVSGQYAIGAEGFKGFDIYIDGKLFLHGRPSEHSPRREYEFIELKAGEKYNIRFDYPMNDTEYAVARLLWDMPNPNLKQEALQLASQSDVVIMCMGLSPSLEGEEMKVKVPGFNLGDREDILLPASQQALLEEVLKLGKKTILVLLNGSAVAIPEEADQKLAAILEAWYPGQAGGKAIADILLGDYNPSGRLPLTFYKNINQIPAFEEYNMKGKTYRYFEGDPWFAFGFGLSYSTFRYEWQTIPEKIQSNETLRLKVNVTNTSERAGDEVVQLYVTLPDSKLRKPIRALQGFQRVFLQAGETKQLEFTLAPGQLAARDANNLAVVEAGAVRIAVGGQQPNPASLENGAVIQQDVKVSGNAFYVNN